jgi:hypothetical protein
MNTTLTIHFEARVLAGVVMALRGCSMAWSSAKNYPTTGEQEETA